MFGLGSQEVVIITVMLVLGFVPLALALWALIDILKNEFSGSNKIIWILLVILLPPLGILLYFFIGRKQKLSAA